MAVDGSDVDDFELVEHPHEEFKVPTPYASDDEGADEPEELRPQDAAPPHADADEIRVS